jgi:hypothetical protein
MAPDRVVALGNAKTDFSAHCNHMPVEPPTVIGTQRTAGFP